MSDYEEWFEANYPEPGDSTARFLCECGANAGGQCTGVCVEDEDDEIPPHVGFEMEVDGTTAHVLGDPNMDAKTRDAIAELIRHTIKWLDDKDAPEDEL